MPAIHYKLPNLYSKGFPSRGTFNANTFSSTYFHVNRKYQLIEFRIALDYFGLVIRVRAGMLHGDMSRVGWNLRREKVHVSGWRRPSPSQEIAECGGCLS